MKVMITETLTKIIEVNSVEEAEEQYYNCEVVLSADDFEAVVFEEIKE